MVKGTNIKQELIFSCIQYIEILEKVKMTAIIYAFILFYSDLASWNQFSPYDDKAIFAPINLDEHETCYGVEDLQMFYM